MTKAWIADLVGGSLPADGERVVFEGVSLVVRNGILRDLKLADAAQLQTRDMFAYKWQRRSTYASENMEKAHSVWLDSRYGGRDLLMHLGLGRADKPLVLDAGCGAG